MRSLILLLLVSALAAAAGAWLVREIKRVDERPTVSVAAESTPPRIDEIRQMSDLVVAELKISFIHTEKLESGALIGLKVGAVKAKFAVRGDVVVSTDLSKARYLKVHPQQQRAVLELPVPEPKRPRVDHERTQVIGYEREGAWTFLPSHRPEEKVTSDGLRKIQRILQQHAQDKQQLYIKQAKQQVLKELGRFYKDLGWDLEVVWTDGTGPHRFEPDS
ncbi:MAG: DUF4230 domain-containing protein [Phycisphaeraceae bacterium]|nr:DUF4230 domain-containing protein [Phycisphaeraceae bacterium]